MKKSILIALICLCIHAQAQDNKPVFEIRRVIVKIEPGTGIGFYGQSKNGNIEIYKEPEPGDIVYSKNFEITNYLDEAELKYKIGLELEKRSVSVSDFDHIFMEFQRKKSPDYAIALVIDSLFFNYKTNLKSNCNFFNSKIFSAIKVLNLRNNLVVFDKKLTSVHINQNVGRNEGSTNFAYYLGSAFANLVNDLYNDPDFKKLLEPKKTTIDSLDKQAPIKISKYIPASPDVINLKKCQESVVTIVNGSGHGSGSIISSEGLILTCYHCIYANTMVEVLLSNGVTLKAKVVRTVPEYDIALLQLQNAGAVPLPLGSSTGITAGQDVWVIGTPGFKELGQTVSKGVISGERLVEGKQYLQTDAAINPGNSGGPVFNSKGQIIGIVNAKIISKGIEGLGFAIPISTALEKLNVSLAE
jgi:S1-C subfamily serine protease